MSDIVEDLRSPYTQDQSRRVALEVEAADEIQILRAEIERLRADAESCRKDAERMQEALAMIATATTEDGCTCDNGYTPMWMAEEALTATLQEKRTPENMVLDRVRSAEQNR